MQVGFERPVVKKYFILIIFLITMLFSHKYSDNLQAKENKPVKKSTLAVMKLQANNCSPSIARAVTDILMGELYSSKFFILLERDSVDFLAKENKIKEESCVDEKCVLDLGKLLSVDKIITGSVNKLGDYRLKIRIINVSNSKIDFNVSENISDTGDFEKGVSEIVYKIKNYYLEEAGRPIIKGDFDIAVSSGFMGTFGDFSRGAEYGFGINFTTSANKWLPVPVPISLSFSFYSFSSKIDSIDSFFMMPVEIFCSFPVKISRSVKIIPAMGVGVALSRVRFDTVETRTYSEREFTTKYYANPIVTFKPEIHLQLTFRWFITIAPFYSVFFEENNTGHFAGGFIGARMLF